MIDKKRKNNMSYFICNGPHEGPFELNDLKNQNLKPDTLVTRSGMNEWKKAEDIEEIAQILNKKETSSFTQAPMPKTWLVESILATLFCCLPFGLVGLIQAAKVSALYSAGKYSEALVASQEAGKWTKISIAVGIIFALLYFSFWGAGFVLAGMN